MINADVPPQARCQIKLAGDSGDFIVPGYGWTLEVTAIDKARAAGNAEVMFSVPLSGTIAHKILGVVLGELTKLADRDTSAALTPEEFETFRAIALAVNGRAADSLMRFAEKRDEEAEQLRQQRARVSS